MSAGEIGGQQLSLQYIESKSSSLMSGATISLNFL